MKKDTNHPFRRLLGARSGREEEFRAAQYEEGRVRFLVRALRLTPAAVRQLRQEEERRSGRPWLTLRAFNDLYPSFPILLGADELPCVRLHLDPRAMLPALFRRFRDAPFVQAYERFRASLEVDELGARAVGLVFPRRGVRHGLLVTDDELAAVPYRGLSLVHSDPGTGSRLYVRLFQNVVEGIYQAGWRAED
jgi:hypothetical protein